MRETLAAYMLHMAKYPQLLKSLHENESSDDIILCDPMCGSGTILAEAALMATLTPAAFLREKWGFIHLPDFSQKKWEAFKREQFLKRVPLSRRIILMGNDINPKATQVASQSLRLLGFNIVQKESQLHQTTREDVWGDILLTNEDMQNWSPSPQPSLVMTNVPYGERIGVSADKEYLPNLYRNLGDLMKQKTRKPGAGWILGPLNLSRSVGLRTKRKHVVANGGLECRLLEYSLF